MAMAYIKVGRGQANVRGPSHSDGRGLSERPHPDIAACGAWALTELQRLCHMATARNRRGVAGVVCPVV